MIQATIVVDDRIVASGVMQTDVPLSADAQFHYLRVVAECYEPWPITLRGVKMDARVLRGPVGLVRVPATQRA